MFDRDDGDYSIIVKIFERSDDMVLIQINSC